MKYLLDTDICSYYLRGKGSLQSRFETAGFEHLAVSQVTLAELEVLAYRSKFGKITREAVGQFARSLPLILVDPNVWAVFPAVKAQLLMKGRPLGDSGNFDILLACQAAMHNLTLVSNNERHFESIRGVLEFSVENWVKAG